ncbi:uncharacterized protein LOC112688871 isoform X1 [Sipha flava]|uniref:Uncharacterized protein LOC112688871 isoform X1 n=1 Tax=Sipha flava TaxID=143950 RepID=A0A8B8G5S9_9HEMI|nr:uncharacterized protein LOC112688871 isoform X1 [Sipha flava]
MTLAEKSKSRRYTYAQAVLTRVHGYVNPSGPFASVCLKSDPAGSGGHVRFHYYNERSGDPTWERRSCRCRVAANYASPAEQRSAAVRARSMCVRATAQLCNPRVHFYSDEQQRRYERITVTREPLVLMTNMGSTCGFKLQT